MDVWTVYGSDGSVYAVVAAGPEHAWHQFARVSGVDITAVGEYVLRCERLPLALRLQIPEAGRLAVLQHYALVRNVAAGTHGSRTEPAPRLSTTLPATRHH